MDVGQRVAGCLLHERIHSGGFATTWFGTDKEDAPVTLRLMRRAHFFSLRKRRLFQRGINMLACAQFENIIGLKSSGAWRGRPYALLEFIEGKNLKHWILGSDTRWLAKREELVRKIARALDALHSHNILHLDLKPENVMLGYHGEVKLIDFDLACYEYEASHWRSWGAGTPSLMAPEIFLGAAPTRATDYYQLGMLLRQVYPEKTGTVLDSFVADCLRSSPTARPQSLEPLLEFEASH